jgi:hypothetical protein
LSCKKEAPPQQSSTISVNPIQQGNSGTWSNYSGRVYNSFFGPNSNIFIYAVNTAGHHEVNSYDNPATPGWSFQIPDSLCNNITSGSIVTSDNNRFFACLKYPNIGIDSGEVSIFKIDISGNILLQKKYKMKFTLSEIIGFCGANSAECNLFLKTGNIGELFVMNFDVNGDSVWTKKITVPVGWYPDFYRVKKFNSDFYLVGRLSNADDDGLVCKLDVSLNVSFIKTFGLPAGNESLSDISFVSDGSMLIGSIDYVNGYSNSSAHILHLDNLGNLISDIDLQGGNFNESVLSVQCVSDSTIFISGTYADYANNFRYPMAACIKLNGEIVWKKYYTTYGDVNDSRLSFDNLGNIILVGSRILSPGTDYFIIKLDQQGNMF